jgi:hypothetical protein
LEGKEALNEVQGILVDVQTQGLNLDLNTSGMSADQGA